MITYLIIALTALVSIPAFTDRDRFYKLAFIPAQMQQNMRQEWYRFFTHAFVHSDFTHLGFNMLTLFFFGPSLERVMDNPWEYVLFYFSSIYVSSYFAYRKHRDNPSYVSVGASGAVSAVLLSLVLYAPWSTIYISFFVPIYYVLYAIFFIVYSRYMDKQSNDNIAHDVHLIGGLYGILFMAVMHPKSLSFFWQQILHPPFLS